MMPIDPKPRWNFPPVIKGQMLTDPVQAEFFTAEEVGGIAQALMRESVQNALDARRPGAKRVGVRFRIFDVAWQDCRPYLEGLLPHVSAVFREQGWDGAACRGHAALPDGGGLLYEGAGRQ